MDSYDEKKCEVLLFSRFVKNETWQVPTLVLYQRLVRNEADLLSDERLKYIPPAIREEWKSSPIKDRTPEEVEYGNNFLQANLKLVGDMRHAGVQFMEGTDMASAVSYIYPGFSLHDELALLVQAGLTRMEAFRQPLEIRRNSWEGAFRSEQSRKGRLQIWYCWMPILWNTSTTSKRLRQLF